MVMLYAVDKFGNIVEEVYCQTMYGDTPDVKGKKGVLDLYALQQHSGTKEYRAHSWSSFKRAWTKIPIESLPRLIQMKILMEAI